MTSDQATAAVVDVLDALQVPYLLVGALSSNLYGIPRSTKDADFLVLLSEGDMAAIAARLGPQFRLDPQLTFETVTAKTRYIVHLVDVPYRIEFFRMGDDPFDRERFARRKQWSLLGRRVFVPTPEDVIIVKLRWSLALERPKDAEDARGILAVQGDRLDWDYINHWSAVHGTRELLDRLRASIPAV